MSPQNNNHDKVHEDEQITSIHIPKSQVIYVRGGEIKPIEVIPDGATDSKPTEKTDVEEGTDTKILEPQDKRQKPLWESVKIHFRNHWIKYVLGVVIPSILYLFSYFFSAGKEIGELRNKTDSMQSAFGEIKKKLENNSNRLINWFQEIKGDINELKLIIQKNTIKIKNIEKEFEKKKDSDNNKK